MADSKRCGRVAEFIRQEVALLLERLNNSNRRFFTITKVEVKKDLRLAVIYFSVLEGEKKKNEALDYLQCMSSYLRKEMSKGMRIRYIPEICFKFDPSIEYSARVSHLLKMTKT